MAAVLTVVAGAVEGHGQQELNATYSDDGIHPNSAGNAASMPVLKANIQTIQSGRL